MISSTFFNAKAIGKSLKQVTYDLIKTEHHDELIGQWYHAESVADLYTWSDTRKNILKQQLTFHGLVVEWNCLEGIKTGFMIESDMSSDVEKNKDSKAEEKKAVSESVHFDSAPVRRTVQSAIEILSNMECDAKFLEQILENFQNPQHIKTMKPDEFIDRFGLAIKNYPKNSEGFWQNLKNVLATFFK